MDLECPYCEKELNICHDDGFGYEEGVLHQMNCDHCEKSFVFHTSISFYFEPNKADCLNEGEHDMNLTSSHPKEFSKMRCSMCEIERELSNEERSKFNIGTKESYLKAVKWIG